jgi:Uma2 family endonuclease
MMAQTKDVVTLEGVIELAKQLSPVDKVRVIERLSPEIRRELEVRRESQNRSSMLGLSLSASEIDMDRREASPRSLRTESDGAEPSHWRFTVWDYHRMAEVGILMEDDPVELIDGEIVKMPAIGARHINCVNRLTQLLVRRLGDDVVVSIQNPVRLDEYHEPQPDATMIRAREYGDDLPAPRDVLLLIEVADTSLGYDRGRKLPLYARFEIPEYWLVDLQGEEIERHTSPVEDTYGVTVRVRRGQEIESLTLPELVLKVDEVLG